MMVNFKMMKEYSRNLIILCLLVLSQPLFAENSGQIININQGYQIAFTDLGNRTLKQGDIVKVSLNADDAIYLQVLESSTILSKLGPSQIEGFRTNLKDFQRLTVGNLVVKVNPAQEKVETSAMDNLEAKSTVDASLLQMQKLEEALSLAKEEIKHLQAANEAAKAKLNELVVKNEAKKEEPLPPPTTNNKEVLEQLKVHLENMHKLVNEGN